MNALEFKYQTIKSHAEYQMEAAKHPPGTYLPSCCLRPMTWQEEPSGRLFAKCFCGLLTIKAI